MTAVDLLLTVLVLGVIVIAVTVIVGALAGGGDEGRAVSGRVDEGNAAPSGEAHRLIRRQSPALLLRQLLANAVIAALCVWAQRVP